MSYALIGALGGLALAVAEYMFFGKLMQRVAMTGGSPDTNRVLDWVRKGQLVLFPVVGFFIGRWTSDSLGVS